MTLDSLSGRFVQAFPVLACDECLYASLFVVSACFHGGRSGGLRCHLNTSCGLVVFSAKVLSVRGETARCRCVRTAIGLSKRDLYTLLCCSSMRNCWLMAPRSTKVMETKHFLAASAIRLRPRTACSTSRDTATCLPRTRQSQPHRKPRLQLRSPLGLMNEEHLLKTI